MVKGDDRVVHVLKSKLNREAEWKCKKTKFGLVTWHKNFTEATDQPLQENSKWSNIKKNVKSLVTDNCLDFWRNYIRPLVLQGNFLKIIELEKCDLTWRSIILWPYTLQGTQSLILHAYECYTELTILTPYMNSLQHKVSFS